MEPSGLRLNSQMLDSMAMAKVFKEPNNPARINSLDFYKDGELLITSSDDESMALYSCTEGKRTRMIYSKKYGVDLVRFTHHPNTVICASKNEWDESLRYLSLHDNKYLRYFKGHRDKVVSLAMSPKDDMFISGSLDNTIRLWDLNTNSCQGLLRRKGRPCVSFDPAGLIFAVATAINVVKLYDLRSFDKGPFSTFLLDKVNPIEWSGLKFSNDGKYILLSTTNGQIFLIDSFTGEHKQTYYGGPRTMNEASFSPDGQFVLGGCDDGSIHVWEAMSGREVAVWKGHAGPVGVVQFNPKLLMVASGCSSLVFWTLPDSVQ
eukprot:TRINITY_DN9983_c0_g1_i1.p1 TRINITY_DN9983_c0_g1~~TRINITY_DN9983_c0_g1_i1.p1  ORF type:complete len:354 (-),score=88.68 TRINITY_DN9983_c0_g1_i1:5-961(-)